MGEKSPLRLTQITRTIKRRDLIHIEGDRARQYAVFVFLILLGLLFLFNSDPGTRRSRDKTSNYSSFAPGSKQAEQYMDKSLQDAAKRTELESLRVALDNKKWAPKIDETRIGLMQKQPYQGYQGFTKEEPEDKA
ncbi:MAG: hypothetical protein KDD43_04110, partial [Bdellovibrionales bacterium]|nr:hypothetical protein [Bdellovibrionales bacterium]